MLTFLCVHQEWGLSTNKTKPTPLPFCLLLIILCRFPFWHFINFWKQEETKTASGRPKGSAGYPARITAWGDSRNPEGRGREPTAKSGSLTHVHAHTILNIRWVLPFLHHKIKNSKCLPSMYQNLLCQLHLNFMDFLAHRKSKFTCSRTDFFASQIDQPFLSSSGLMTTMAFSVSTICKYWLRCSSSIFSTLTFIFNF